MEKFWSLRLKRLSNIARNRLLDYAPSKLTVSFLTIYGTAKILQQSAPARLLCCRVDKTPDKFGIFLRTFKIWKMSTSLKHDDFCGRCMIE